MTQMVIIRAMGDKAKVVDVKSTDTVRTALKEAGINPDMSMKIMVDDKEVSLTTKIGKIDDIMLVPAVKGGN